MPSPEMTLTDHIEAHLRAKNRAELRAAQAALRAWRGLPVGSPTRGLFEGSNKRLDALLKP